jgi:hypothetical protein
MAQDLSRYAAAPFFPNPELRGIVLRTTSEWWDGLAERIEAIQPLITEAAKDRLYNLMSDISEECYCAGWMSGNEYTLWAMVRDPAASRHYGMSEVSAEDVEELRQLSEQLGGWVVWWDDGDEPGLPATAWGRRFLPMAEWLKRWDEHAKAHAALGGKQ